MQVLDNVLPQLDVEPREYQVRLATKSLTMFQGPFRDDRGRPRDPANSILLESPTGSGKTVMGLLIARCLQEQEGHRIGWVAMRRNLLAQAAAENATRRFGLDLQLISMFDRAPPPVDFLVVDEAQHDGAMSMATLHAKIRPRKILGLTATPFRSDRVKLCFEHVIRDIGIQQLIQADYLSRYHHYTIDHYTPQNVAESFARDQRRWGKSLLFFHRYEQCLACQQELRRHGVAAEIVTSQSNRQQQLDDFERGRTRVLISMAILTEGFDCPSLKTVFCRPSGKGCTIQMCGRVFRKFPSLPYKQVVQCRNTRHPIIKTASPDEQYVWMDGQWRSLTANRELTTVSANAIRLIAQSRPVLPRIVAQNRTLDADRGGHPWRERFV